MTLECIFSIKKLELFSSDSELLVVLLIKDGQSIRFLFHFFILALSITRMVVVKNKTVTVFNQIASFQNFKIFLSETNCIVVLT